MDKEQNSETVTLDALLVKVREQEEWAAREEAMRFEVEELKAELDSIKRVAEGSGGVDGKLNNQLWPHG